MPMTTSDWMQIAVPTPARDGIVVPVLGTTVTAVLEGRCPKEGAETLIKDEIWDGMIPRVIVAIRHGNALRRMQ